MTKNDLPLPGRDGWVRLARAAAAMWIGLVRSLRGPRYDAFISYKSHDVGMARAIADQLIGSGLRVWFAEYQILLRRYEKFQAAIDMGIRRSRYGVAITNDRYADSVHCQHEMRQLLEHCEPGNVLEVRLPPEPRTQGLFPALARSPSHDGQAACMDWRYRLDVTGWTVTQPGHHALRDWGHSEWREIRSRDDLHRAYAHHFVPVSFDGPELRWDGDGPRLMMNLHAGPESSDHRHISSADDREMYRELMTYLPRHLHRLPFARLRGLHLLFHDGRSQLAVTYRWGGYWTRKCSVIVRHPQAPLGTEFVFTFGFKGSFEEYCRRTCVMERVVASLEWRDEGRYIAFYLVSAGGGPTDLDKSRVLAVCRTRAEAQEAAAKSGLRAFAWSEPALLSRHDGEIWKDKIQQFERDY
jgi:hypothetical protein